MPELHINVDNPTPAHGDTITATFTVTGNDGTPAGEPTSQTLDGEALLDGQPVHVFQVITLPGTPEVGPVPVEFVSVTLQGLTFTATTPTGDVWTAVVP